MRVLASALGALALVFFCASLGIADADDAKLALEEEIAIGVSLYDDLEYEAAIDVLTKALENSKLADASRLTGLRVLGLAQVAVGEENGARDSFRRMLEIDRAATLDAGASPRARELLVEVRSDLPGVVELRFKEEPPGGREGAPVTVTVTATDPSSLVSGVVLHYGDSETAKLSTVQATRLSKKGDYAATIPAAFVRSPRIHYYVTAHSSSGKVLAAIGSSSSRRSLSVLVLPKASSSGVSPYIWVGAGALAIAAGGVAAYFLTREGAATESVTVIFE